MHCFTLDNGRIIPGIAADQEDERYFIQLGEARAGRVYFDYGSPPKVKGGLVRFAVPRNTLPAVFNDQARTRLASPPKAVLMAPKYNRRADNRVLVRVKADWGEPGPAMVEAARGNPRLQALGVSVMGGHLIGDYLWTMQKGDVLRVSLRGKSQMALWHAGAELDIAPWNVFLATLPCPVITVLDGAVRIQ